ncbi:MAG: hypothetical protein FJ095_21060 [Deltaproteobacteria bacterium]|nr:hypothetical protein [Deltaproteobacteria bacterium]
MTVASDALVLSALAFGMLGCTDLPDPKKGESDGAGGGSDALTWSGGIRDIFQQNCVRCHASGQFSTYEPMQTYQQLLEQVPNIAAKIQDPPSHGAQMPPYPGGSVDGACEPAHPYSNDLRMPPEQIEAVLRWIGAGKPEGAPSNDFLLAEPPAALDAAVEYAFDEGYVMSIGSDDDDGHRDDWVCVIVDPELTDGDGFLSGIQINSGVNQVFRGGLVRLDKARESLAFVGPTSTRNHGVRWYDCDEGFGFAGDILGGFLPEGEPIETPEGSAVRVPQGSLIVYKIHYHGHYDTVNPDDTDPLPPLIEWPDHTSLSLRWEDPANVARPTSLLTFGNYDTAAVDGTGSLTPPFELPGKANKHVESMVTRVPGKPSDAYAVWAVQPEMGAYGLMASVSVTRAGDSSPDCLAANPRWIDTWQLPLTIDPVANPVIVHGGDRLQLDCQYRNPSASSITLADESCRAMIGLLPME